MPDILNGMCLTQSYEPQRDLLTQMAYRRGNTLVAQRSYTYDILGRPTERSTARQGSTRNDTFTHNSLSELTAVTLGTDSYAYDYDNIGNAGTCRGNDIHRQRAEPVHGSQQLRADYRDIVERIWSREGWNKYADKLDYIIDIALNLSWVPRHQKRHEKNWGNYAVRLIPLPGTNTYNRNNFNIHGGFEKGSGGCIDVGKNDTAFFEELKKYGDALYLYVDYSKKKSAACQNCSRYYKDAWING